MTMHFKKISRFLIVCLAGTLAGIGEVWSSGEAESVVVLANASDAESVEIANYYASKRGIPLANVIALPMPVKETISVREYLDMLHNPLLEILIKKKWVKGVRARRPDFTGREGVIVGFHNMSYLVTTKGVPLRIANKPKLLDPRMKNLEDQFRVNNGSVDSELALLIRPNTLSMTFLVPNPLFAEATQKVISPERVIRVSRLDGPYVNAVKKMIDRTLKAEADGLMGRAYFDTGGPYALGDEWIRTAGELAKSVFFDTDCEATKRSMDEADRLDAPAIYMGWYRQHAYGPWSKPCWSVPPGAIGFHLHSGSAKTLRSTDTGWLGAFVNQGYCATVGNVYEPYLEYTHRPDILLKALLEGHTFGEAVMLCNPVLSWQGVAIGDPLYRPFKVDLATQLQAAEDNPFRAYAYLREINRLEANEETDSAFLFAKTQFRQFPSLPLAYRLAQLYVKSGETEKALEVLEIVESINVFAADEIILGKEIADFLSEQGESEYALSLYKSLISQKDLSKTQQIALFDDGSKLALQAGNTALSSEWAIVARKLK